MLCIYTKILIRPLNFFWRANPVPFKPKTDFEKEGP